MLDEAETGAMQKQMLEIDRYISKLNNELLVYIMQRAHLKLEWRENHGK